MNPEKKPINSIEEIPRDLSDEDRMDFLEQHGVSEAFLATTEDASDEERPRPRTKPINVRFDAFTLGRLKALADRKNVGYQTLLKTFVQERLYEEEKREGLLSAAVVREGRVNRQVAPPQYDTEALRQALASLDPVRQEALWLYFHEALKLEDVAGRLEISLAAAHRLITSGIRELREELGGGGAVPEDEASIKAALSAL